MNDDHIPVPSGHAPRLEMFAHANLDEVTICERDSETAWISINSDDAVEVRQ